MVASFFIAELTFTKPNARLMFEGFIPTAELFRDKELLLSAIA